MNEIDRACRELLDRVEGATACGVIDLDSCMVLGVQSNTALDPALIDVVAAAAVECFRGPSVTRVEEIVRAHFNVPDASAHGVREVYLASASSAHFARTIRDGHAIVLLVTDRTANIGMGWSQLRAAAQGIEGLIP